MRTEIKKKNSERRKRRRNSIFNIRWKRKVLEFLFILLFLQAIPLLHHGSILGNIIVLKNQKKILLNHKSWN